MEYDYEHEPGAKTTRSDGDDSLPHPLVSITGTVSLGSSRIDEKCTADMEHNVEQVSPVDPDRLSPSAVSSSPADFWHRATAPETDLNWDLIASFPSSFAHSREQSRFAEAIKNQWSYFADDVDAVPRARLSTGDELVALLEHDSISLVPLDLVECGQFKSFFDDTDSDESDGNGRDLPMSVSMSSRSVSPSLSAGSGFSLVASSNFEGEGDSSSSGMGSSDSGGGSPSRRSPEVCVCIRVCVCVCVCLRLCFAFL